MDTKRDDEWTREGDEARESWMLLCIVHVFLRMDPQCQRAPITGRAKLCGARRTCRGCVRGAGECAQGRWKVSGISQREAQGYADDESGWGRGWVT